MIVNKTGFQSRKPTKTNKPSRQTGNFNQCYFIKHSITLFHKKKFKPCCIYTVNTARLKFHGKLNVQGLMSGLADLLEITDRLFQVF